MSLATKSEDLRTLSDSEGVRCLRISPLENWIAYGTANSLTVVELRTFKSQKFEVNNAKPIASISWSPNEAFLLLTYEQSSIVNVFLR